MHIGGKIEVRGTVQVKTRDDLSMAYTPGVARVCSAIASEPERAWSLTVKGNMVAVVSDGTAVLGLGDIGPEAAMPVMEGKALLFKEFANVDAFPLCIDTTDVDEIVAFVTAAAPTFGGINLEDIAAPRCFEIERRLRETLDIPVFHDDQHGTAIVTLAALLNALRVVGKAPEDIRVVVTGAGAAGMACTNIMLAHGIEQIVVCDVDGVLYRDRPGLDPMLRELAERTNPLDERGTADELLAGADVYLGVSAPGAVSPAAIRTMAPGAIVFAMANPTPEVMPEQVADARRDHGHGPVGLPEPDQQRARLPGRVPGRAGRAREHDQRGDEARRGARDRLGGHGRRDRSRVHHPERVQPGRRARRRPRGRRRGRGHRRRAPPAPGRSARHLREEPTMESSTSASSKMLDIPRFDERVALVTGGSRGIGRAISLGFAMQGATVATGYSSNKDAAEAFRGELSEHGSEASIHQGNVGSAEDCRRVIDEVIEQHGRLDILVNNAGITIDKTALKLTDEDWYKVLAVNLSGAFFMSQAALRHMGERGTGRIVNISSVIGSTGNIGQANYAASKSGLFGLTYTLAKEAAFMLKRAGKLGDPIGLTVNTVTPGFIATEMLESVPEKVLDRIKDSIPLGRLGEPEEVARVVRFLVLRQRRLHHRARSGASTAGSTCEVLRGVGASRICC